VAAPDEVYDQVLNELAAGSKRPHWIWFIFPKLAGLGFSSMSQRFGIIFRSEAQAHLNHPIRGARLTECTELVLGCSAKDIRALLGYPDNHKFRSSMTLFAAVSPDKSRFKAALDKYFGGEADPKTLSLLGQGRARGYGKD